MSPPTDANTAPSQPSWVARAALGVLRWPSLVWLALLLASAYQLLDAALQGAEALQTGFPWAVDSLLWSVCWAALLAATGWGWVVSRRHERQRLRNQAAVAQSPDTATCEGAAAPSATRYLALHACWAGLLAAGGTCYLGHAEASAELSVWGGRLMALVGIDLLGAVGIQRLWLGRRGMWRWGTLAAAVGVHAAGLSVGLFLAMRALFP